MPSPCLPAAPCGKYDFRDHIKGDTIDAVQFTMEDNTDPDNPVPINLTGAAIRMQLRVDAKSKACLTLSVGSGITITDAVNGVFQVDAQVIDINPALYLYDIEFTIAGVVKTWICGKWRIIQDITHG